MRKRNGYTDDFFKGCPMGNYQLCGNMAQAAESNLIGNGARNNKQEQVHAAMFTELNKITKVLTQKREARNGLVTIAQKLNG